MLLSPAVLALVGSSLLLCGIATVAAAAGLWAAWRWNPDDGGARQLARERRLLLVEATLAVVLACQALSLLLFVFTVDRLAPLLTGAMCAAGSLTASPFGWPALGVKLAACILCGLWWVAHRASVAAAGTALVRAKLVLAAVVLAALVADNFLQIHYFSDLEPEIITSCCAILFGTAAAGEGSWLATLPAVAGPRVFSVLLTLTLAAGLLGRRWAPALYAPLAVLLALVSAAAVVAWVAPGFYQSATHHCPFCLLSPDVGYVGLLLYGSLAVAALAGAGAGLVRGLRVIDPLGSIRPGEEHRLCRVSMAAYLVFAAIAAWPAVISGLRLEAF